MLLILSLRARLNPEAVAQVARKALLVIHGLPTVSRNLVNALLPNPHNREKMDIFCATVNQSINTIVYK